jgi:hypothetical protein
MRTRIAAALTGLTLAAGTLVGTAAAAPDGTDRQDEVPKEVREVLCKVLKDLNDKLKLPELDKVLKELGCDSDQKPTETSTSEPSENGGR